MALIQRFGGTYYADFRTLKGKRSRISLQTTNLRVAKDKYAELVSRRKKAKENLIVDMEWDAFKDRLFRFMSAERSESTIRWTKLAIKHMEDFNTPRLLRDVTPNLLQGTKEFMINEGFGKHNVNRCMQALKAIMRLAEKWDLMPEQKWKAVGKLKTPKGRVVFHTDEEIDKLLAACPSLGWRIVVLLGADAGLRRGEIMNLRWEDVDFNNNQLYIAPNKTEYYRFVPMTENLRSAIERAKIGAESEFVVDFGRTRNIYSLTFCYKEIAKAAGVDSFLHKLRHTFASQLVQNGVELYAVSKLLGHRSIQMTEIYAHLAPAHLHKAVMNLPKRGMTLVGVEEKTVCEDNKACKQIGIDLGDLMKK